MQRTYVCGAAGSISLLCLAQLRLIRGRVPCRSPAPGYNYARSIHPSAMATATEHAERPKNKLALSSSPYLKQHETNPVRIALPTWPASRTLVLSMLAEMDLAVRNAKSRRSIGIPGARRLSKRLVLRISPSSCQLATAHATGELFSR